jgi:ATP-dependent protease ClpP protease subunit
VNPYELRQKFHNLAVSKTPWYKIINQAEGPTEIHIFNVIGGGDGLSADEFIHDLSEISGPVQLRINSEGGEVFQAKPIYNALSRLPDVGVVVDGIAASAASFIAMAASPHKLFMSEIGTMMIHDGMAMAAGTSADLRNLADVLDKESDTIASIYAARAGKEASHFRDKMRKETWYNAQEALDEGLCDGIINARSGKITNVLNAASVPYVGERQARHEPMTGRHRHDHAAYEAGDHDDGMHYHLHEHHNDADHQHTHAAGMGAEGNMHTDHDTGIVGQVEVVLATAFPEAQFYNRTFTTEQRKSLAKKGHAMSDGSYPIENCQDAANARQAYGRAPEGKRAAVAAHIRKRESALGGCGRDAFSPGSDNKLDLGLTDEEIQKFTASLKGAN